MGARDHFGKGRLLGLFTDSLNEVIDLNEVRINVARYRIPRGVLATLYLIAFGGGPRWFVR